MAEPQHRDFPTFSPSDIDAIRHCLTDGKGQQTCTVPRSVILKYDNKLLIYKGYARECVGLIRDHNRHVK